MTVPVQQQAIADFTRHIATVRLASSSRPP
jgi:hypothetical protein